MIDFIITAGLFTVHQLIEIPVNMGLASPSRIIAVNSSFKETTLYL